MDHEALEEYEWEQWKERREKKDTIRSCLHSWNSRLTLVLFYTKRINIIYYVGVYFGQAVQETDLLQNSATLDRYVKA